jgi:hypothetical protein
VLTVVDVDVDVLTEIPVVADGTVNVGPTPSLPSTNLPVPVCPSAVLVTEWVCPGSVTDEVDEELELAVWL